MLLIAVVALLPITPDESWRPDITESLTGRILALLLTSGGLPFFLLASDGPLVQAWRALCIACMPYPMWLHSER